VECFDYVILKKSLHANEYDASPDHFAAFTPISPNCCRLSFSWTASYPNSHPGIVDNRELYNQSLALRPAPDKHDESYLVFVWAATVDAFTIFALFEILGICD
jgi:hypothetical protein